MGQEVQCSAHVGGRTIVGKAMLETDELLFRGDERVRIRLADIKRATAADGRLVVRHKGGTVSFELGKAAIRWAERINHPPTLADKLGVKPGHRVALVGFDDPAFTKTLEERGADVGRGRPRKGSDVVFLGVHRPRDLDRLETLEATMARAGAVWVVYPKGRKDPSEVDVIEAGKAAGFVDVKVARFSDTHTALKLVIPKARR
jgi:hypothetical protein